MTSIRIFKVGKGEKTAFCLIDIPRNRFTHRRTIRDAAGIAAGWSQEYSGKNKIIPLSFEGPPPAPKGLWDDLWFVRPYQFLTTEEQKAFTEAYYA